MFVCVCVCVCVCVVAGAVDGVAKLCSSRMWWCRVILKFGGGVLCMISVFWSSCNPLTPLLPLCPPPPSSR